MTPVNDPPDAVDDSVNTPERTPITINVLGNDTDVDGDPLTITSINGTPITLGVPVDGAERHGHADQRRRTTAASPNSSSRRTPAVQGPVTGSFTYGISDGKGGTDTATVNVTVGGVNDAPVANPDTDTTNEDTALVRAAGQGVIQGLTAAARDTDVDGDTLTVGCRQWPGRQRRPAGRRRLGHADAERRWQLPLPAECRRAGAGRRRQPHRPVLATPSPTAA